MWKSYSEFVAAQQTPAPAAEGPRLPTAIPVLLRQLGAKSPQQIMLIQQTLNQQIQQLLQQKNAGVARRSIRGTMVNARNDLQNFGRTSV